MILSEILNDFKYGVEATVKSVQTGQRHTVRKLVEAGPLINGEIRPDMAGITATELSQRQIREGKLYSADFREHHRIVREIVPVE